MKTWKEWVAEQESPEELALWVQQLYRKGEINSNDFQDLQYMIARNEITDRSEVELYLMKNEPQMRPQPTVSYLGNRPIGSGRAIRTTNIFSNKSS